MNPLLILSGCDFELITRPEDFPKVLINISAIVGSMRTNIDAVEMTAFREKVRAFVERELPKHVKIKEARHG